MTTENATFGYGAYTATFDTQTDRALFGRLGFPPGQAAGGAQAIGLVEGVIPFTRTAEGRDVRAGKYADTVIDGIYRGGQQFISMIFKEWTDIQKGILWPWGGTSGGGTTSDFGVVGPVGAMMSDWAGTLILTAETNTPAKLTDRKLIKCHSAIIAAGHNFDINMGHDESDVPIVFRCFPMTTGAPSVPRWADLS